MQIIGILTLLIQQFINKLCNANNCTPKNEKKAHCGKIGNFNFLNKKCKQLNIEKSVRFLGFFKTQHDIYEYALNAKIYVLPTYHDIIPGTLIESMFIKLPVIAYSVGGIPEINSKEESVKLVEKQNINQLANSKVSLLENPEKRNELAQKAYRWADKKINNEAIVGDILNAYKAVLNN